MALARVVLALSALLAAASTSTTCIRNTNCSQSAWCLDTSYDTWCPANACPSPMCVQVASTVQTSVVGTTSTAKSSTTTLSTMKTTAFLSTTASTKVQTTSAPSTTPASGSWSPCVIGTSVPGADIADDAGKFPNPFVWYTNTSYPGVTLPGPSRGTACNWKVGVNFVWTVSSNQCILNGAGYPMSASVYCSNGLYRNDQAVFTALHGQWYAYAMQKADQVPQPMSGATTYVVNLTIAGQPIRAAMSIGHRVLGGLCGDCFLIRRGTKYVVQLQTDVRAWSLELTAGANTWLASDNVGGTCYIPDVQPLDCTSVLNSR